MALSAWVTCRSRLESRFVHGAPARICVRTGGGTVHGGRPVLGASDRHQAYQGARAARGAHVLLSGRCHGPRRGGRSDRPAPRSWAVWPYATRTQGPNLMRTRPVNHRIHGGPSAGKGGDRHGGRPMDLRHRRVLRTLRLGHRDGGTPVEGARRSATEALSENPSGGCETDALTQICVAFFLFLATLMWFPPTLHLGVTAAIILLVLIVPIAHRWFTHRVR
jgi:hypothetical protein